MVEGGGAEQADKTKKATMTRKVIADDATEHEPTSHGRIIITPQGLL
jgi:hypothetical protein